MVNKVIIFIFCVLVCESSFSAGNPLLGEWNLDYDCTVPRLKNHPDVPKNRFDAIERIVKRGMRFKFTASTFSTYVSGETTTLDSEVYKLATIQDDKVTIRLGESEYLKTFIVNKNKLIDSAKGDVVEFCYKKVT